MNTVQRFHDHFAVVVPLNGWSTFSFHFLEKTNGHCRYPDDVNLLTFNTQFFIFKGKNDTLYFIQGNYKVFVEILYVFLYYYYKINIYAVLLKYIYLENTSLKFYIVFDVLDYSMRIKNYDTVLFYDIYIVQVNV